MLSLALASALAVAQPPAVEPVLAAAGRYIAQYERDVTTVVAEEEYVQETSVGARRRLRSDVLFLRDETYGWIGFRDVFEVDTRPVRDRDERLIKLFLGPRPNAIEQARRIAEEGSRFDVSLPQTRVRRSINMPLAALRVLQPHNQHRAQFRIDRAQTAKAKGLVVVAFTETTKPRLFETPDHGAARGTFWIDPESGCVEASTLVLATGTTTVTIRVTYREDAKLQIWLPASMDEEYDVWVEGKIEGRARYSNFRRFAVETTTEFGPGA